RSPMTEYRVQNTRWLVVSAPTRDFARACGMPYDQFQTFYKKACLVDYQRMAAAAAPLRDLLLHAKDVRIAGRETDIRMTIDGIGAKARVGKRNIPDGESYTAPNKTSVEGTILFGPSVYQGKKFDWIKLRFAEGKAVEAWSRDDESTRNLNRILDADE